MSSVISSRKVSVKGYREGVKDYGDSQVDLEPEFQPATKDERRKSLEHERPYITRFEYADFPGYAVIHVSDATVSAEIYPGDSDTLWKTIPLAPVVDN